MTFSLCHYRERDVSPAVVGADGDVFRLKILLDLGGRGRVVHVRGDVQGRNPDVDAATAPDV